MMIIFWGAMIWESDVGKRLIEDKGGGETVEFNTKLEAKLVPRSKTVCQACRDSRTICRGCVGYVAESFPACNP